MSGTARPLGPLVALDCPLTQADLHKVKAARLGLLQGGFAPLVVNSPWSLCCPPHAAGKAPLGRAWQRGHDAGRLLNPGTLAWAKAGANTGLLLGFGGVHVQALDVDVEDAETVAAIAAIFKRMMPAGGLVRVRSNSARVAILLRCESGAEKARVAGERGAVERLASGQQVVVHGWHKSGVTLDWTKRRAPWTVAAASLPLASEKRIAAFLGAVAGTGILGAAVERITKPQRGMQRDTRGPATATLRAALHDHGGAIVPAVETAIREAGARGSGRHNLLVSVCGLLVARGWPSSGIVEWIAPLANGHFGAGDWTHEVAAAVAHAEMRRGAAVREAFGFHPRHPARGDNTCLTP